MERAAGPLTLLRPVGLAALDGTPIEEGIKKAGGPIWPTARGSHFRRFYRLRLTRDGHRSPVDSVTEGRHRARVPEDVLHSDPPPWCRTLAGDLRAGGESTRLASASSTPSDDDVGDATDDVGGRSQLQADDRPARRGSHVIPYHQNAYRGPANVPRPSRDTDLRSLYHRN